MYIYIYIYIYTHTYVYTYLHTCMHMYIFLHLVASHWHAYTQHLNMHTSRHAYIPLALGSKPCACKCKTNKIPTSLHICMYVCTHTYAHTDTPLHLAATNGHAYCCNILISAGAHIDAQVRNRRAYMYIYICIYIYMYIYMYIYIYVCMYV